MAYTAYGQYAPYYSGSGSNPYYPYGGGSCKQGPFGCVLMPDGYDIDAHCDANCAYIATPPFGCYYTWLNGDKGVVDMYGGCGNNGPGYQCIGTSEADIRCAAPGEYFESLDEQNNSSNPPPDVSSNNHNHHNEQGEEEEEESQETHHPLIIIIKEKCTKS